MLGQRKILYGTLGLFFVFLFVFFTLVQPLVVFDGDDWEYLAMTRSPIPLPGHWNPTRVLPETFTPVIGYIAAYVVTPILGDYLFSITVTSSFFISALATMLCGMFIRFCMRRLCLNTVQSCLFAVLFLAFHFSFFKSRPVNNEYLLGSANFCCYMFYVIPNLLNGIIVLWMLGYENIQERFCTFSSLQKGAVILALYFAICSNILNNYILGVFCASILFLSFLAQRGTWREKFRFCYSKNKLLFWIEISWFLCAAVEATGGRAHSIGRSGLLFFDAAKHTWRLFAQTGKPMLAFIALVIVALLLVLWMCRKKGVSLWTSAETKAIAVFSLSTAGSLIYLVILCAKASPGYASRADVQYGTCLFFLCLVFTVLASVLRHVTWGNALLPLAVVLIVLSSASVKHPLRYSTMGNIHPRDAMAVSQNLIDQTVAADAAHQKEMTLIVPKGDNRDNWPHPNYMGFRLPRNLLAHGLIEGNIKKVTIQPDPAMNEKYYHK